MSEAARQEDPSHAVSLRPGPLRLDLLHAFVVLAEDLHYTRAAGRLYMSQPGLSRQIRQLEVVLGASLVHRSTRAVELTDAGRALLPHAEHILATAGVAQAAVRHAAGECSLVRRGRGTDRPPAGAGPSAAG